MPGVPVVRHVDRATMAQVATLADRAAAVDGYRFLSDHLWLDLVSGRHLLAAAVPGNYHIAAYAQASRTHGGWTIEATVDPDRRGAGDGDDLLASVLTAVLDAVRHEVRHDGGGRRVTWWTHDVSGAETDLAEQLGLAPDRDLMQMRRTLPSGLPVTVTTRSFLRGEDEQAVLDVNNRAFADHLEQGGWDLETLQRRLREPWFDPDGLRLHERRDRLAAFCWTKLHDATGGAAVGEIYVIAVDPEFQGLGLGRQLTLAGLESIEQRGVTAAMLYVEGSNTAALGMYERLGFWRARLDRAFGTVLTPSTGA